MGPKPDEKAGYTCPECGGQARWYQVSGRWSLVCDECGWDLEKPRTLEIRMTEQVSGKTTVR